MRLWITQTRDDSRALRAALGITGDGPARFEIAEPEALKAADGGPGTTPKLGFGESGPNGERWITLHPNGDDGPGQRVLIRPSAHNKGQAHVVGGAGGRLNYLKIQLKSPDEYRQSAKDRKDRQKQAAAAQRERAKIDGSEMPKRPGRTAALKTIREQHGAAQADLEKQIAQSMGWTDTEPPAEALRGLDEAGKAKAIKEHQKKLRQDVRAAVRYAKDWLASDAEARAAAFTGGIPFAGGPDRVGAEDLIGTDAIRRGLGYRPMSADLDTQALRAEKARFIEGRMREEMATGKPGDTAILARRLAEHRAIQPDEVATAPPEVLAGLARAVADRLDHLRAVADEDDPETAEAIRSLESIAGAAGTTEDALDFANENPDALRAGLEHAMSQGLLDPERVDGMRQQAENLEFERIGAPRPDDLTAEHLDSLDDAQVKVLAQAAAKKARGALNASPELREQAAELSPDEESGEGKKRGGKREAGGKDPTDTRTGDLFEEERQKHAATEEAVNGEMDPATQRDFLRRALEAGIVGQGKDPPAPPKPARALHATSPEQAYKLLLLQNKLRAAKGKAAELEQAVKEGREIPGVDYDATKGSAAPEQTSRGGFVDLTITEEDANAVQAAVERDVKTLRAQALLGTVARATEEVQAQGQLTADEAQKSLQAHLGFGAADALNSHAQQILGGPSLDRQVIDTLGAEGAAQLLAWATHTHRPDEAKAIGEAVGDFHQRDQTARAQSALDEAKVAWTEAHALHQQLQDAGPRADLKEWAATNGQRLRHLEHARKVTARALGQMEATAALHAALTRKPPSQIRASMGQMAPETAAAQAHAIGLTPEDFEVQGDGQGNTWLHVKASGFQKLVRAPDPEGLRQQQALEAIKSGQHDEKDWLPAGFARRSDPAPYSGPAAPMHAAPMDYALKNHEDVDAAVRTHIAQRVHDGWRPADIAADLQNVGHHVAQLREAHGNADHPEVRAWKADNPEPPKEAAPEQGDTLAMFAAPAPAEPSPEWKAWDQRRQEAAAAPAIRAYQEALERHMPSRDEKVGALQMAERYGPHFRELAQEHAEATGAAGALHQQTLHPEHARDATFRALSRHPAAVAAFKDPGDLSRDEQAALRGAFRRYFDGGAGKAPVPTPDEAMRTWAQTNAEPAAGTIEHARWIQAQADAREKALDAFEPHMPPGERLDRWKQKNQEPSRERVQEQEALAIRMPGEPEPAPAPVQAPPEHVDATRQAHEAAQSAADDAYAAAHAGEQRVAAAKQALDKAKERHGANDLGGEHPEVARARGELDAARKEHGEATQAHVEAERRREEAERAHFAAEHGHTDPRWQTWKKKHDEAARGFHRDWSKNHAPDWSTYTLTHGNAADAYKAVQGIVRGRFLEDFRAHYQALTGQPLKGGPEAIPNADRHRVAFDPEFREHVRKVQRRAQGAVQDRGAMGRFMEDQVRAKRDRKMQEHAALQERQTSATEGAPPTAEEMAPKLLPQHGERFSLGEAAEAQIAQHVGEFGPMIDPTQPFRARTSIRMDGNDPGNETVKQQRAIKSWIAAKKMGLFLGPGSGKTNVAFGTFGELRKSGRVQRGLFAVPSAVQGQFGTEALSYLEPGAMKWWANPGAPREERLAAYRNPDTHAVVVTHQSLRDDVTHMVAAHLGLDEDEVATRMRGFDKEGNSSPAWSREEMDKHVKEALQKHGADGLLGFLAVDEGHTALNRQGKQDSHLARVVDSLGRLSEHAGYMTGSPVKNDASEVYDWMAKVAHTKYHDGPGGIGRDEFMRRYGNDLPANQEALRREMARYTVTGRVDPGTQPRFHHETLPPTEAQHARLDEVDRAYSRARLATRRGDVDVDALRTLMPKKFEGADDERAQTLAEKYSDPLVLASIRDGALRHAINLHQDSAKLARVVELANQYRDHVDADGEPAPKPGVIFAHDLAAIPRIEAALKAAGHRTVTLRGAASGDKKQQAAEAFQRGDADVMILSDAGEAGLNLQRGKYLIHHDVPLTWKTWEQRTARINRLGQMDDPDIHTLMLDHEHEAKAWERAEHKRDLGEAVMDGGGEALDESGISPFIRARLSGHMMAEEEDADAPAPEPPAAAEAPPMQPKAATPPAATPRDAPFVPKATAPAPHGFKGTAEEWAKLPVAYHATVDEAGVRAHGFQPGAFAEQGYGGGRQSGAVWAHHGPRAAENAQAMAEYMNDVQDIARHPEPMKHAREKLQQLAAKTPGATQRDMDNAISTGDALMKFADSQAAQFPHLQPRTEAHRAAMWYGHARSSANGGRLGGQSAPVTPEAIDRAAARPTRASVVEIRHTPIGSQKGVGIEHNSDRAIEPNHVFLHHEGATRAASA